MQPSTRFFYFGCFAGRFAPLAGISVKKGSAMAGKSDRKKEPTGARKSLPLVADPPAPPANVLFKAAGDKPLPMPEGLSTASRTRGMPAWKPRQLGHISLGK
jgi:hypothetical protein